MRTIKEYLKKNLVYGLKNLPTNLNLKAIILIPFYILFALIVGFTSNVLEYNPLNTSNNIVFILPFSLFFFPSLIEEVIFRGILLPYNLKDKNTKTIIFYIFFSTLAYTLIHLLYTIINPISAIYFENIYFLLIVFFLGVTCSIAYIYSQSLWLAIIIHWVTVVVWVTILNGRNLIFEV